MSSEVMLDCGGEGGEKTDASATSWAGLEGGGKQTLHPIRLI